MKLMSVKLNGKVGKRTAKLRVTCGIQKEHCIGLSRALRDLTTRSIRFRMLDVIIGTTCGQSWIGGDSGGVSAADSAMCGGAGWVVRLRLRKWCGIP